MAELKEGEVHSPIFKTEVKGLGKVQFFKDDEKNCCWFTVSNYENGSSGWTAAKSDSKLGIKFFSVNSTMDGF